MSCEIDSGVARAVAEYRVPDRLGFGAVHAPVMYETHWSEGRWGSGKLRAYGPIEILPGARALHYAECIFEGLKAYRVGGTRPNLFRARDNWLRMARSAGRLAMPMVAESQFFEAIDTLVGICEPFIPRESGRALYLRPFVFGTEAGYLVRNSATFTFMIIANPVEAYSAGALRVAIERNDVRAAAGGIGAAKAAANYAASLRASSAAVARGLTVALWLDARERRYIQELSGMNLFAVIGGVLHTPELDGAILAGVTRDSLITLGRHLGYQVVERRMALDELLAQIVSGECSEVFACGTAAIVSPIEILSDAAVSETVVAADYRPRQTGVVAGVLREALLAVQERRAPDLWNWTRDVRSMGTEDSGPTW